MSEIEREAASLFQLARSRGARTTELLFAVSEGYVAEAQRGRVTRAEPVASASVTVRCWDARGAEGEATGPVSRGTDWVDAALASAAAASPDHASPPAELSRIRVSSIGIDDRRYPMLTADDRQEVLLEAEKDARAADRRLRVEMFGYRDERLRRALFSSRGGFVEEASTTFELSGSVSIGSDGAESLISEMCAGRAFASVAALPVGSALAARAVSLLGPSARWNGAVRAWMPPRVVARWVDAIALSSLRGDPWTRVHGSERFHDALSIVDDASTSGALRATLFDDRGQVPAPVVLVREGARQAEYLAPADARRRGARPTGHWFAGAMRPGPLVLRAGQRSMAVILGELEGPLFLVDDLDAAVDPDSGRFEGRANGVLVHGSERLGAVRGGQVSGKLTELLGPQAEISSDADRVGHVDAPGLRVEGLFLRV